MVADGSYKIFKSMCEQAVKNGVQKYVWESKSIDTTYAQTICTYVDKHVMPEYDNHLLKDRDYPEEV